MTADPFIETLRGGAGQLPPGRRRIPVDAIRAVHRRRLIAGMAEAGVEKGYAATTIADVVRHAQVSRRTFYEHFADKEECFVATYEECTRLHRALIAGSVRNPTRSSEQHVRDGVAAFVQPIASSPALAKLFVIDIVGAGPRGLEARRRAHRRYARLVVSLVGREGLPPRPDARKLSPLLASAFIGAVNEIVFLAVEGTEPHATLDALQDAVNDVFFAITALGAMPADVATPPR